MDKKLAHNVVLGAFITLGIAAFVFIIFNMGGGQGPFSSTFSVYGTFRHVKGLHYGSEVSLAGLRIGTVKEISVMIAEDRKELIVEMAIDTKNRAYVREDSIAIIRTQGVLGDKYIEVSIGSPDKPELEHGAKIATQEEDDFFSKSGGLVEEIKSQFETGGNFESLLLNLNKLVANLNGLATDIKTNTGIMHEMIYGKSGASFKAAVASLDGSLKKLDVILAKIQSGEGTLGALINDPTLYEDIKLVMGGAKRSSVLQYFIRTFGEDGAEAVEEEQKKKK